MTQSNLTFTENQVIPEGYKKTGQGLLPQSWNTVIIRTLVSRLDAGISVNSVDSLDTYSHGKHVLKTSCVSKGYFLPNEKKSILPVDINRAKTIPEKGSIIVSRMNTPELVGELGYVHISDANTYLPDRLWQMIFKKDQQLCSRWLAYLLSSKKYAKQIKESATGTSNSMKNISKEVLLSLEIPYPKFDEQQKIATALSDTDALISELEKLIEKKRAIKTATMQQLLTGKTRLPEFALREDGTPKIYKESELGQIPEDWEVIEFQNLLETTILKRKLDKNSEVTFISMQDVSEKAELKHQHTLAYENIKIGLTYFERNDTLVAKITPCFENGKGCFTDQLDTAVGFGSTEFHVLRSNSNTYPKFIYYWTLTGKFRKSLEKEMVGSAGHRRVPFKEIQKFKIQSSLNKDEQRLISKKISNVESELKVLEAKLEKIRKIKLGMMQELLTGKTRLF